MAATGRIFWALGAQGPREQAGSGSDDAPGLREEGEEGKEQ